MVKAKSENTPEGLEAALAKLKMEANAKERELIEMVAGMYESVKESQDKVCEKVVSTASTLNNSVTSNPWPYIGGAALGGFLLGLCSRR